MDKYQLKSNANLYWERHYEQYPVQEYFSHKFAFGMALDDSKTDEDILDEEYGVSILIEKKLSNYLEGAIIDYTGSETGGGFEIRPAKPFSGGGCDSDCCGGCGGSC